MSPRVALVVGTRPEAIKMAPVYRAFVAAGVAEPVVVSSGQHRELLRSALEVLEVPMHVDLDVMTPGQTLNAVLSRVVERIDCAFVEHRFDAVLIQGDTTTALAAALAAYHRGIPVGHVEAGLRTYDHAHPFPEEGNRQLIDRLCQWCFAPTDGERANLLAERIATDRVHVTGNTVVDAIVWAAARSTTELEPNTVLLTLHRRESFGGELDSILLGLRDFLEGEPSARVFWPVHPNPNVAEAAARALPDEAALRITRVDPMPYVPFAGVLRSARVVLTDSGGIQEEGPSLGKIVLVARERTERPTHDPRARNRLIGRARENVRDALLAAWAEPPYSGPLPAPNPFGDGHAGERIAALVAASIA